MLVIPIAFLIAFPMIAAIAFVAYMVEGDGSVAWILLFMYLLVALSTTGLAYLVAPLLAG